jgi:hypothetical protein
MVMICLWHKTSIFLSDHFYYLFIPKSFNESHNKQSWIQGLSNLFLYSVRNHFEETVYFGTLDIILCFTCTLDLHVELMSTVLQRYYNVIQHHLAWIWIQIFILHSKLSFSYSIIAYNRHKTVWVKVGWQVNYTMLLFW